MTAFVATETSRDLAAAEVAAGFLEALGIELQPEHLRATPGRMARAWAWAWAEMLTPREFDATTFPAAPGAWPPHRLAARRRGTSNGQEAPLNTPASPEVPTTMFADGASIPLIGFGTGSAKGSAGADVIASALRTGYRLLDTAAQYGNETAVGEGLRRSGVDPDDVLVTTKVAGGDHGREAARTGILESLRRLGLEQLGIALIHWPNPSRGLAVDTWRTLLELREEGLVAHVGVSNFRPEQLQELFDATGHWPEINQIQLSPARPHEEPHAFHREHGILTQAWGPLGTREGLSEQFAIRKVAAKHEVPIAQVALRWAVDREIVVIPRSSDAGRQRQNLDLAAVRLDDEDRALLASLDLGEESAWD
ncbi:MAG: aldo/keto reductase, partial [Dermabacteraceae bacterium]